MLAVIAGVNTQVAEREELVEMIAIALLTGKNLFILGAPGQAKLRHQRLPQPDHWSEAV
jgi:MoxR-like ATPase